tara:strand:+ start:3928 stop:4731 length:804 start_codon:yes stop_codon:yes gene_type:complete
MNVMITTALFDINRQSRGDGRTILEYLTWMKETLKVRCSMTVYTEKRFEKFIYQCRKNIPYETKVIVQDLSDLPFDKYMPQIREIMFSEFYRRRIKHPGRVECVLPEYNLIQYSKFGWLEKTAKENQNYDYFFWMDAGCSRFFLDADLSKEFPNINNINVDKFLIQRNTNFEKMWENLKFEEYIWDNRSMLTGGLFGGGREVIFKMKKYIEEVCENIFFKNRCINNEQFAIAIISKLHTDLFDIRKQVYDLEQEGSNTLPLFKSLLD